MTRPPGNFAFLSDHAPLLAELGATAERLFPFDPASCVLKLRLLAEAITQDIAARLGLRLLQPSQAELLRAVDARLGLDPQVRDLFHLLRRTGNQAAHEAGRRVTHREGMDALRVARELAVWFHRSFGPDADFRPGPFRLPDDPSQDLANLQQQLADLQARLHDAQASQAQPPELAAMAELARLRQAEAEQERALAARAQEEAATRPLIDAQLIEAGWQTDSQQLIYASSARPQRGRSMAIAEWPAPGQQAADDVLFAGLLPLATVEAKGINTNVAGKIGQTERYARGLQLDAAHPTAWNGATTVTG